MLSYNNYPQHQQRILSNAKSADCLKLDLNYKMTKKSQVKLLNAKIRKLKNKCKALRQQSKTDRQILSNLINTTTQLQNKTQQNISACKQVSTQLSTNHNLISINNLSQINDQNITQIIQSAQQLALQSNCNQQKTIQVKKQLQSLQSILQSLPQFISNNLQDKHNKHTIYNIPTDRSITASLKSQGNNQEQQDFIQDNLISTKTYSQSGDYSSSSLIKRANTYSFSSKSTKVQRHHYYYPKSIPKKSFIQLNSNNKQNTFIKYIYALISVIIITLIFFKLITN